MKHSCRQVGTKGNENTHSTPDTRHLTLFQVNRLLSNRGFTLIEALISLAIFSIGVLAIIVMLDTAFAANRLSRDYTNAANIAGFIYDTIRYQALNEDGSANRTKIATFDNDSTPALILDTKLAGVPMNEPGRSAYQAFLNMIQRNLLNGRGVVTIVLEDPNYAHNTSVSIRIEWSSSPAIARQATFLTILHPRPL